MNLHWPESVFGKQYDVAEQAVAATTESQRSVDVLIDGKTETFAMVDEAPLDSSQLRLMRLAPVVGDDPICVTLQTYQDNSMPEYEAVSYSLGGENRNRTPNKPIYIGSHGDIMLLTDTCAAMLRFLSPQPGEASKLLWFDYLCINQHDMAERDCQMPKMRSVYGLCTRVVVYLGDDIVQRLGPGQHRRRHWLHEVDEVFKSDRESPSFTLKDILERDYFKRTWVIQEILLAETVVIPIRRYDFRAGPAALNRLNDIAKFDWNTGDAPWLQHMGQASIYSSDLREALHQTWQSRVTDPRDKINGILGLVENDPQFTPDSTLSWFATFIGTCAHLIKRGHTELLLQEMDHTADPRQLSWLPEWTDLTMWDKPSKHLSWNLDEIRRCARDNYITTQKRDQVVSDRPRDQQEAFRVDCIFFHPEDLFRHEYSVDPDLVPKLSRFTLCPSTAALGLTLGHLLTLKTTPELSYVENTLKAFKIVNGSDYVVITTLNGDLDILQTSDEMYLHIETKWQLGILFGLRRYKKHYHKIVLTCILVDVLLVTNLASSTSTYPHLGIHYRRRSPALDFDCIANAQRYGSTFGKTLFSILREIPGRPGAGLPSKKDQEEEMDRDEEVDFSASPKMETRRGVVRIQLKVAKRHVLSMSQAIIDDEAEPNEIESPRFRMESENWLRQQLPEYMISMDGTNLTVPITPNSQFCVEESRERERPIIDLGLPGFHAKIYDYQSRRTQHRELFALPDQLHFDFHKARETIIQRGVWYSRLRYLIGFRRQTGLKETQLFETSSDIPREYGSIYPDFQWPCAQSVVDELGLVGEMKEVQIL